MSHNFLLDLALILLSTKFLSITTKKFHFPQIIGAILAGVLLGPSVFRVLTETDFIKQLAELGVIGIMFSAGLGVKLKEIKNVFRSSFLIALLGVLVPVAFGIVAMILYNGTYSLEALFVGIIFSATSIAISIETLKEIGKLDTKVGEAILTAAVIDDILGIIALAIGMGVRNGNVDLVKTFSGIGLFFLLALVMGFIFEKIFENYIEHYKKDMRRFTILAFVFCLFMAYVAEHYFGISGIIGAFIAGLVISETREKEYIKEKFEVVQYMLFTPIFFASIGLEVAVDKIDWNILKLLLVLILVAVLSKVIGCGIGALVCKYSFRESMQIGFGMIGRGEVALILAKRSQDLGIISNNTFTAIVITVIFCAIVTPILIKCSFKEKTNG